MPALSKLAAAILILSLPLASCAADIDTRDMRARGAAAEAAAARGVWLQHLATDPSGRDYSVLSTDRPQRETAFDVWLRRSPHLDADELRRRNYIVPGPGEAIRIRFDCRARTMQVLAEGVPQLDGTVAVTRSINEEARAVATNPFEDTLLTGVCRGAGEPVRPFD